MTTDHSNIDAQIAASLLRINEIEKTLWADHPLPNPLPLAGEGVIKQYHTAFQQLEQLIATKGDDRRHEFIIVIPVADRPQHLQSCLDSLLHLCKVFGYGGYADNCFQKVSVIIADDSKEAVSISKNKAIASECNKLGLVTLYFGLDEQLDQLDLLSAAEKSSLCRILGTINEEAFYHKGAAIMRNIAYLELNKILGADEKLLFYFIDSDQEFQLKVNTTKGDKNLYACNYFFNLDRIFSTTDTAILTGKVVGDPPVSPAVMAGNFLDDVIGFLLQMAAYEPSHSCQFHSAKLHTEDASYHDMSELFGFKPGNASFQYLCHIKESHDNAQCFRHFSSELNRFFYGEHPTRKTYYQHEDVLASVRPARTIYSGNYIFRPAALKHFIPFAPLKLRMAGPMLGRLIKAEIADRFVSANLPMLHNRTLHETGKSEFRAGISEDITTVDLSGEFERQFYGDVMLFSIEKLTDLGYPEQTLSAELIAETVAATHTSMLQQYNLKRQAIAEKLDVLKILFDDQQHWWQQSANAETIHNFKIFIANIEHNFGQQSPGYALIHSAENKLKRHAEIIDSLACYKKDRISWEEALARHTVL
jgi:hypothetical protein